MKQITLLTTLMILVLSSWGQTRMQLAFTASPSVNWMNTSNRDVNREKIVLGYDFGLLGDIFFAESERYALQTGLLVVNTGGNLSYRMDQPFSYAGETLPADADIKYRLRYLDIPFSIKLKTNDFHRAYYWGLFGLSGMVNIGARGDSDDGALRKTSIHDEINMFNIGMNVGLGFDYGLGGSNSASFGLLFQNGLTDVTTDNALVDKTILNSLKVRLALVF
ncbi:MAG TPA: porin family protein [Prolixibacteraceae bacterium]|nr:porin family protein [Prolixibacteraceae bacterium]